MKFLQDNLKCKIEAFKVQFWKYFYFWGKIGMSNFGYILIYPARAEFWCIDYRGMVSFPMG